MMPLKVRAADPASGVNQAVPRGHKHTEPSTPESSWAPRRDGLWSRPEPTTARLPDRAFRPPEASCWRIPNRLAARAITELVGGAVRRRRAGVRRTSGCRRWRRDGQGRPPRSARRARASSPRRSRPQVGSWPDVTTWTWERQARWIAGTGPIGRRRRTETLAARAPGHP